MSSHWSRSDVQCDLWPSLRTQKKEKKTVANWLFAQTTHVAVPRSKFACRVASGVQFYISSFIKIGPVVLPLWVVEYRPSPLLWPVAYTTACTVTNSLYYRTSRDIRKLSTVRFDLCKSHPMSNIYSYTSLCWPKVSNQSYTSPILR